LELSRLRLKPLLGAIVAAVTLLSGATPALGAAFVVDTTSDNGALTACTGAAADCSLRGALLIANVSQGVADTITFDPAVFPSGAPATITIGSSLTTVFLAGPLTIDGTGAGVIVDGAGEPSAFDCFDVNGPHTVRNLQITDCTIGIDLVVNGTAGPGNLIYDNTTGIRAQGSDAVIQGDFIGTNAAGTAVHPSGGNGTGISITGSSNTIGGGGAGNLISGNSSHGVTVSGGSNIIQGNKIGITSSGPFSAVPNGGDGLQIIGGAINLIGGNTNFGAGNIISGHGGDGVEVTGGSGTVIKGNQIGIVSGVTDIGNTGAGVFVSGAAVDTTIGGTAATDRNIISGNGNDGIALSAGTGTVIKGNLIGLGSTDSVVANGGDGIGINAGSGAVTIGGTTDGERNVISGNLSDGIEIATSGGHAITGNYIGLAADGSTDRGNTSNGVLISNSNTNTIGGDTAGERNVVSGNTLHGVEITGTSTGNTVAANYIGTDAGGTLDRGNSSDGVRIDAADGNTIGGTGDNHRNVVSGNNSDGIDLITNADNNDVLNNYIGKRTPPRRVQPHHRGVRPGRRPGQRHLRPERRRRHRHPGGIQRQRRLRQSDRHRR
jgi:hypothetical protein